MTPLSNFTYAVIGAGIEGSATAYFLAKHGFKTVLLEQFRLGHTRGSSHGGSRITRKAYEEPIYVEMMIRAYQLWDDLEKEVNEQLFKKTGLLYLGSHDCHDIEKCKHAMAVNNVPIKMMDHKEIKAKYPYFKFDEKWQALYDEDGGLLKADRCLKAFQDQFLKHGGKINDGDAVTKIDSDGEKVKVETASGVKYEFAGVAICGGTWAKSILKNFFNLDLPIQPRVVKSCYWKIDKKNAFSTQDGCPCILSAFGPPGKDNPMFYGVPADEYSDMFKFCSHGGVDINHPDERDSVDASFHIRRPQEYIAEHFDHVIPKPAVVETCLYTVTPDENFVLDAHPKYKNVVIGAGFSGHGFKFATVVGEILGTLLTQKSTKFDLDLFCIGRFS